MGMIQGNRINKAISGNTSTTSTTNVVALAVTGSGILHMAQWLSSQSTNNCYITIEIDGVALFNNQPNAATTPSWAACSGISPAYSGVGIGTNAPFDMAYPFQKSLVIRISTASASFTCHCGWMYELAS